MLKQQFLKYFNLAKLYIKKYYYKFKSFIIKWFKLSTWQIFLIPENPKEHPRLVRFLFFTLSLVLFFVVIGFIISFSIIKLGNPTIRIPSVENKNILDAIRIIQSENLKTGFEMRFSDNHKAYTVIKQYPSSGVTAREGREIILVVSLGQDIYTVPFLCNLSKEAAIEILTKEKIPYLIHTVPTTNDIDTNKIIALNFEVGQKNERSIPLILTITENIKDRQYQIDDFIRQPIEYVATSLYNNHILPIIITTNVESDIDDGLVLDQNIPAGENLIKNSSVILTVGLYGQDAGEREKMKWYVIKHSIPKANIIGKFNIITNEDGISNTIITPEAPTAKYYKAVLEDELGRVHTIYDKTGAEGTTFVRVFKAYGKATVYIYADNDIIGSRKYGQNN